MLIINICININHKNINHINQYNVLIINTQRIIYVDIICFAHYFERFGYLSLNDPLCQGYLIILEQLILHIYNILFFTFCSV